MAGPEGKRDARDGDPAPAMPPGHFLSAELASDCARFLEEVRGIVRRRAEADTDGRGLGRTPARVDRRP